MAAFQKEKEQIISILEEAHHKIGNISNPEMHWLLNKIMVDLKKHIDATKSQIGENIDNPNLNKQAPPLTKMFGKTFAEMRPSTKADVNVPGNESSFEVEEKELQMKVAELWPKFLETEADHLLDSLTDLEIRGVAKHAGLPVTEFEPKKITTEFIQMVKDALQKKIEPKDEKEEENDGLDSGMDLGSDDGDTGTSEDGNVDQKIKTDEEATREQFQKEVNDLTEIFSDMTNKDILESYGEMQIRGVAKKAGLEVTKTEPKMESTFVTKIKEAIKHKAKLDNATK